MVEKSVSHRGHSPRSFAFAKQNDGDRGRREQINYYGIKGKGNCKKFCDFGIFGVGYVRG